MIMAYGQTGAGKTYTMLNNLSSNISHTEDEGIVGLAIEYLFDQLKNQGNYSSQVLFSFFEIYNESIRDLLQFGESQNLVIM